MIHVETSHLVNTTADFPDDFRVINGDGVSIVKNPTTNEMVLQVPANCTIVYKKPNPEPVPVVTRTGPPTDVPPSMKADGELA